MEFKVTFEVNVKVEGLEQVQLPQKQLPNFQAVKVDPKLLQQLFPQVAQILGNPQGTQNGEQNQPNEHPKQ